MHGQPTDATLPLRDVDEPPTPLRSSIDSHYIGRLADDIAARGGLLQRIGVRREPAGRYTVGFGHCRLLAHRLLAWPAIEARVWPEGTDLLDIAIAENEFRKELNPIEDARAMRQLMARGEPIPHIARRYRVSDNTVRARLALLELPEDLQQTIDQASLSVSVAVSLAAIDHLEYRASLIDEAKRTGATARVVAVWAAHYAADRDRIVSNHLTVQEIALGRETYVVYVACDACHAEVPYTNTRGRRFCGSCDDQLTAALQDASRETSQASPP